MNNECGRVKDDLCLITYRIKQFTFVKTAVEMVPFIIGMTGPPWIVQPLKQQHFDERSAAGVSGGCPHNRERNTL
jgi:hypothetical protein